MHASIRDQSGTPTGEAQSESKQVNVTVFESRFIPFRAALFKPSRFLKRLHFRGNGGVVGIPGQEKKTLQVWAWPQITAAVKQKKTFVVS